ncbi:LytR/AlgR family response regulator transcription factor [Rheinheimera baltica]|uniref:LytR/AlgR family response regulator transcription factor n=1 Tax=Rheinheimera baltica TaxID=67576 RepID=UPI0004085195|nr:response regulator transcription factor [Rheinheimera baltica]
MLNTVIIDDEPLAHNVIKHHLNERDDIAIVANCYNATEALSYLAHHRVDLILLDINMPELSGIDMLKVLSNRPHVIIISAYQEYAIDGFALDVVDYLLKPVSAERLIEALNKVHRRIDVPVSPLNAYLMLKVDREKRKFLLGDITWIEAYGNYVKVWQGEHMTLVSSSLKRLVQQLPRQQFVQVHKSFIVNRDKVVAVDNDHVRIEGGLVVKVGRLFKQSLVGLL